MWRFSEVRHTDHFMVVPRLAGYALSVPKLVKTRLHLVFKKEQRLKTYIIMRAYKYVPGFIGVKANVDFGNLGTENFPGIWGHYP